MTTRIVFNGKEYSSPEAMPPDVRRLYDRAISQLGDADGNEIPDIVEHGIAVGNLIGNRHTSLTVNGQTYGSADEMPPDVRRLYEAALVTVGGSPSANPAPRPAAVPGWLAPLRGISWVLAVILAALAALIAVGRMHR